MTDPKPIAWAVDFIRTSSSCFYGECIIETVLGYYRTKAEAEARVERHRTRATYEARDPEWNVYPIFFDDEVTS